MTEYAQIADARLRKLGEAERRKAVTAKEYLNQILKLDKLIENKLSELEHWRMVATGITSSFGGERVQTSGGRSKMEDAVCSYVDSQAVLVEMAEELTRKIGRAHV